MGTVLTYITSAHPHTDYSHVETLLTDRTFTHTGEISTYMAIVHTHEQSTSTHY